jgi:lysophospholipase L1-like esterase
MTSGGRIVCVVLSPAGLSRRRVCVSTREGRLSAALTETITFRGRTVGARQDDGVHLSAAGAAIAATLVIDRLRADGALAPGR